MADGTKRTLEYTLETFRVVNGRRILELRSPSGALTEFPVTTSLGAADEAKLVEHIGQRVTVKFEIGTNAPIFTAGDLRL